MDEFVEVTVEDHAAFIQDEKLSAVIHAIAGAGSTGMSPRAVASSGVESLHRFCNGHTALDVLARGLDRFRAARRWWRTLVSRCR